MKVKVLSKEIIDSGKAGGRTSLSSAYRINQDVNIEYIASRHIGFSVPDKKYKTKHSVIYFSEKEFPECWNCDCKWFSIKNIFCKHILAVLLRLMLDPKFLKNIKREETK